MGEWREGKMRVRRVEWDEQEQLEGNGISFHCTQEISRARQDTTTFDRKHTKDLLCLLPGGATGSYTRMGLKWVCVWPWLASLSR